jgi:Methyltransferase domain
VGSDAVLAQTKQFYVAAMRQSGRALTRAGLLGDEPPPIAHRGRHWAYSLTRVHDSMELARLDVPWWTYSAIDAVSIWLSARQTPVRVFEYGSGASTLWLARRAAEVLTVEHHLEFGHMMKGELAASANVTLHIVGSEHSAAPSVASGKEGYGQQDFSAYAHTIDECDGEFDLVVVDGRARAACLQAATPRLASKGMVIFDNSARRRYRDAIIDSPLIEHRYRGLTPTLPYPEQTSLLVKPD